MPHPLHTVDGALNCALQAILRKGWIITCSTSIFLCVLYLFHKCLKRNVGFFCLHHYADRPLSWPAPLQEDQPGRCTWPCADHDPSCSEPARTHSRSWNLQRLLILQHQYLTLVHSLRQILSTLAGDFLTSAEMIKCYCGQKEARGQMTILFACSVSGNDYIRYNWHKQMGPSKQKK